MKRWDEEKSLLHLSLIVYVGLEMKKRVQEEEQNLERTINNVNFLHKTVSH